MLRHTFTFTSRKCYIFCLTCHIWPPSMIIEFIALSCPPSPYNCLKKCKLDPHHGLICSTYHNWFPIDFKRISTSTLLIYNLPSCCLPWFIGLFIYHNPTWSLATRIIVTWPIFPLCMWPFSSLFSFHVSFMLCLQYLDNTLSFSRPFISVP